MGTQVHGVAGEAPAWANEGGSNGRSTAGAPRALVGAMFTSAKELRHLAEQELGELFVPVEVLAESDHSAVYALRSDSAGRILVHAERGRHWYPFRVTYVEADLGGKAIAADEPDAAPAPRILPHPHGAPRPSIDWL
ncbi:MAG TPA: hypothetical protein VJT67_00030 [Longimicrobiaceae bacterium]|nr:hypothetical protein [Longimicrobiaceae bacterium]